MNVQRCAIALSILLFAGANEAIAQDRVVEVASIEAPYGFLLDGEGRSREEVRLRYRVRGRVKAGDEIWLEIRDQATRALYWRTSIPAKKSSGELVAPKGIQFRPIRQRLSFSVKTSTGAETHVLAAQSPNMPYHQDVDIDQITPSAIRGSEVPQRLRLEGRGFTPESAVVVARLEKNRNRFRMLGYASVDFVDTHTVEVTPQPSWFAATGELLIVPHANMPLVRPDRAASLTQDGRIARLQVVPVNSPHIREIEPPSVRMGSDWLWVTLRGEQFNPYCYVLSSEAGGPLISNLESATEMRAQVPGGFFVTGYDVMLRVDCGSGAVSAERPLRVVGRAPDSRPTLEATLPYRLPPVAPTGPDFAIVRLFGTGFDRGSVAFAHVDGETPISMKTEWISPYELRAVLRREQWGELRMEFIAGVTAPSPPRQ